MKLSLQKKLSLLILFAVLLISFLFTYPLKNLSFNYDFEAFFPNEDNELETYNRHRDRFEWDNEFVLLGIENKSGIFKKDFLTNVDKLTKDLQKLNNVSSVVSPTNIKNASLGASIKKSTSLIISVVFL